MRGTLLDHTNGLASVSGFWRGQCDGVLIHVGHKAIRKALLDQTKEHASSTPSCFKRWPIRCSQETTQAGHKDWPIPTCVENRHFLLHLAITDNSNREVTNNTSITTARNETHNQSMGSIETACLHKYKLRNNIKDLPIQLGFHRPSEKAKMELCLRP